MTPKSKREAKALEIYAYAQEHPEQTLDDFGNHFDKTNLQIRRYMHEARRALNREGEYNAQEDFWRIRQKQLKEIERYEKWKQEADARSNPYWLRRLDNILEKCLDYFDDDTVFATARPAEISVVYGTLFDKKRLIQGLPTEVVRHEDQRNLTELAARLTLEMQSRGLLKSGTVPVELTEHAGVFVEDGDE